MTPPSHPSAAGGMGYTRLYVNGRFLRLYRGMSRKWASDGSRMTMDFWEIGLGSLSLIVGRWRS